MSTTTTKRKETVNTKHCCICIKLRNITLFTIVLSLVLIIGYGFPYWIDPSRHKSNPLNYYIYISITGIEVITSIILFLAVYCHIRRIIKYSFYWIITHIIIISIAYWLLNIFDFLHFAFYIAWVALQILLIYLLWKYKSLLKLVYDWDEEDEHTNTDQENSEPHDRYDKISSNSPNNSIYNVAATRKSRINSNSTNVNVSINLTQQPSQPQTAIMHPQTYPPVNVNSFQHNPASTANMNSNPNNISFNNDMYPNPIQSNQHQIDDNKEVIINIDSNSHKQKPVKKKKVKHYRSLPTEDLELSDGHIDEYKKKDGFDSDSLYDEVAPTKQTPTKEHIDRLDTMDLLMATVDPLPVEFCENKVSNKETTLGVVMDTGSEGADMEYEEWVVQTLEQCAPLNNEWKEYWNNFKMNNVRRDTLMSLSNDKERNEWKQLIPKMGPRIRFQQLFDQYMLRRRESDVYPTPQSVSN